MCMCLQGDDGFPRFSGSIPKMKYPNTDDGFQALYQKHLKHT